MDWFNVMRKTEPSANVRPLSPIEDATRPTTNNKNKITAAAKARKVPIIAAKMVFPKDIIKSLGERIYNQI
jgi:hypothetical protein